MRTHKGTRPSIFNLGLSRSQCRLLMVVMMVMVVMIRVMMVIMVMMLIRVMMIMVMR